MAIMYPKNITQYMPKDSERIVYYELKNQLPDSYEVFYSVKWTTIENGKRITSEADFIIVNPEYGILCLEVKGGNGIEIDKDNNWKLIDHVYGDRDLRQSPYDQAENSMYYFTRLYSNVNNIAYPGIYASGVVFPFYTIPDNLNLDHRHRVCTIDSSDLNHLHDRIKKIYKLWAGNSFGLRVYRTNQHRAMVELIRKKVAISAAAGALVKYKEQQLDVINRVQDNYVYLLSNVRQFFVKGGAGTGKTWIAMKMALQEAQSEGLKILFLCSSQVLCEFLRCNINQYKNSSQIDVLSISELFSKISRKFEEYSPPLYEGIQESIIIEKKYDAIFVDEAQDFSSEWASIVRKLLVDDSKSRLGIFYDDVQILRDDSFGNAFEINQPPYLLRENIRNTASIYSWASEKTNLGRDVIVNPVEGPSPVTEYITDQLQLVYRLELLFRQFIDEEKLSRECLIILVPNKEQFLSEFSAGIAKWKFSDGGISNENEILVSNVEDFKGLESDMIIYIHDDKSTDNMNYIAYTRAKYYLIELIRR